MKSYLLSLQNVSRIRPPYTISALFKLTIILYLTWFNSFPTGLPASKFAFLFCIINIILSVILIKCLSGDVISLLENLSRVPHFTSCRYWSSANPLELVSCFLSHPISYFSNSCSLFLSHTGLFSSNIPGQ